MKDLYEILEVSPKASGEVIEKAYKVLAKKYHPDLQTNSQQKVVCEQKMKQLNEAYEILGDEEKRKQYDEKRRIEEEKRKTQQKQETSRQEQKSQPTQENTYAQKEQPQSPESIYDVYGQAKYYKEKLKQEAKRQKQMNDRAQSAYEYAYEKYLKSLGFKVKKKWTWRRIKDFIKAILIMLLIILAIWLFPPTREWMISFYEQNVIVKALVDFIIHFFQALGARIG